VKAIVRTTRVAGGLELVQERVSHTWMRAARPQGVEPQEQAGTCY